MTLLSIAAPPLRQGPGPNGESVVDGPNMDGALTKLSQYERQRTGKGKIPQLALRRGFVWSPSNGDADSVSLYASLSEGARGYGLRPKLYLLLRWLASSPNTSDDGVTSYDTTREVDQVCAWLGRCDRGGLASASDRKVMFRALEALNGTGLIEYERDMTGRGRYFKATLRHELRPGEPFVEPHVTAKSDHPDFDGGYFAIPSTLITNGWLTWLPTHALHLLLLAARMAGSRRPTIGLADSTRKERRIIRHSEDLSVAGCVLKAARLVEVTPPSQGNQLVREFEFRPEGLKKQAPRAALEVFSDGKRVPVHGRNGIADQLSDLDLPVQWPRPTR